MENTNFDIIVQPVVKKKLGPHVWPGKGRETQPTNIIVCTNNKSQPNLPLSGAPEIRLEGTEAPFIYYFLVVNLTKFIPWQLSGGTTTPLV